MSKPVGVQRFYGVSEGMPLHEARPERRSCAQLGRADRQRMMAKVRRYANSGCELSSFDRTAKDSCRSGADTQATNPFCICPFARTYVGADIRQVRYKTPICPGIQVAASIPPA